MQQHAPSETCKQISAPAHPPHGSCTRCLPQHHKATGLLRWMQRVSPPPSPDKPDWLPRPLGKRTQHLTKGVIGPATGHTQGHFECFRPQRSDSPIHMEPQLSLALCAWAPQQPYQSRWMPLVLLPQFFSPPSACLCSSQCLMTFTS